MVFDNVTLFEVHLDDATISPTLGADAATEAAREDEMAIDEVRTDATMGTDEAHTEDGMAMDAETDAETVAGASAGRRGRGRVVAVVALVGVAGVAVALRRRRGGVAEVDEADDEIAVETVDEAESVAAVDR